MTQASLHERPIDQILPAMRTRVVRPVLRRMRRLLFHTFQPLGIHITKNTYHSPIPDTRQLPKDLWQRASELPGIALCERDQLGLLHELIQRFGAEFSRLTEQPIGTAGFRINNGSFESVDAELLYAIIRRFGPRRMIEIGSGWSTLAALQAFRANAADGRDGHLTACEPYPSRMLIEIADDPGIELVRTPVQAMPLAAFESLEENDILFIDSSHVCKVGSDVQYEILEILPRLRPGVIVHVHDIFLPEEYPKEWIYDEQWFWNEQYIVQAFLCFNTSYQILWSSSHMRLKHPELLESLFLSYSPLTSRPCSLWLRRVV